MPQKNDPHYGALLIEEAKLHLGTVMAGQDSEPFFLSMLQIIEGGFYLEYTTLRNKRIQLKGIKDFLQSVYYGLGIRDMNAFLLNIVKAALKEKSRNRYGHKFIEWLKEQDPVFTFPQEYFEFRRLGRSIYYAKHISRRKKPFLYKTLRFLYNYNPQILQHIGPEGKYKNVEECYYGEGYAEKMQTLKPIKTYRNPTDFQVGQLADSLFERLGVAKTLKLVSELSIRCDARKENADDWD